MPHAATSTCMNLASLLFGTTTDAKSGLKQLAGSSLSPATGCTDTWICWMGLVGDSSCAV